ncbi:MULTISPECIES: hypothetical protein [Thiorhodovibrio]|uniref:hypothetical protein n=1 Tax=Thiorhodovibrio TaxID=61593 RepID=UPI001913F023|nr:MULTISPECIES: hypothetical protein [Thiorhodovibrio]MBK5968322.1 hypothetical protein [Thiorhodovibrio winogradskyi]WPL13229.1 hypothetical protein Thiosp_03023 [Thiorhodovibrio litoralis]
MILEAIVEDQVYSLNVPESLLTQAGDFFDQLDRDMDNGWQMSRDWVDAPDQVQRGQIVADKLLTALENENQKLGMLMAGYLLSRLPGLKSVEFDIQGEIQNNQFDFHPSVDAHSSPLSAASKPPTAAEPPAGAPPETAAEANTGPSAEQLTATARNCAGAPRGLSKLQAMAQAGQDVSKVFKVGKGYRFSVFDHASQGWQDGPLLKSQDEAERLRERVFASRYEALQRAE